MKIRLQTLIATDEDKYFIENSRRYEIMAKCTAPINGRRTASGRANCPVCGGGGYRNYNFPHILHHILRQQAVREVVAVVGNLRQKHDGLRRGQLFYILLRKFEHLPQCVKMLKSVPSYQI